MSQYTKDFRNCKAVICDETNKISISKTVIVEHDRLNSIITVDNRHGDLTLYDRVTVLILGENKAYEYKGTIRKYNNLDLCRIALFKEKIKEGRASSRYEINTTAIVRNWIIANRLVSVPEPFEVFVMNMSATGMLVSSNASLLNIGSSFQMIMSIGDSETVINAVVKRIDQNSLEHVEYGCQFKSVQRKI